MTFFTSEKAMGLFLRALAFSMVCGIVGYIVYVLIAYLMALMMITQFVFGTTSGSPW
ncbi:hypothetical protein QCN36_gp05 [Arthrobacter phage CastorTray]|uniref:Uncharacterized protein n=5 Tax=Gordonvirus TaxID=1982152 RepID=A0A9E7SYP9_9CAUD|nr:hypothetical protein QCN34_gp04 [Arthrobacter phage Breylor17]YP_010750188.1 hypothetical protein QCN36_gp05 [Arthrobacter phage CastorTray]YP_010750365.1 hypothetical protein QCN38_gp04 [Arthrobacter phage Trustiboi]YP_010750455.1 hypothetical protein QCN39_gp04 [Arthrobacter phage Darby]YP_010750637.1 membrane protein [Arthrobacter phage ScienceWizSam]AXH43749.1 hypothetical protein SEA_BREYLOR17_4 [Arthrobacter phage Breylor17]QYC54993.1 hypothetical protein SEA_CASTORTRAY_5 [Arthrobact